MASNDRNTPESTTGMARKQLTLKTSPLAGSLDESNDVLISAPTDFACVTGHVVYFGGDIQDYKDAMMHHRDNWRYVQWSLESALKILGEKFANSFVWVVRPNRMHLHTFAVYSAFLDCNDFGIPQRVNTTKNGRALQSLAAMLNLSTSSVAQSVYGADMDGVQCHSTVALCELPIALIGFSKGCIVLNQMVRDIAASTSGDAGTSSEVASVVTRIREMYWLDGGHSGGRDAWLTDDACLTALRHIGCRVQVHVTPYQINDSSRKWIGSEERKFVSKLTRLGVNVAETVHFADEPPSIEKHFEVLKVF